jgi:hypothetical protein
VVEGSAAMKASALRAMVSAASRFIGGSCRGAPVDAPEG